MSRYGGIDAAKSEAALPIGGSVAQLVAGTRFFCALLADRVTVKCWGSNSLGQLGQNTSDSASGVFLADAKPVDLGGRLVRELAAADSHVCAVVGDGDVICWGSNLAGQLGYGAGNSTLVVLPSGCVPPTRAPTTTTTTATTTDTTTTDTTTTTTDTTVASTMSDSAPPQTAPPIVIIHDNEKRDCMLQPFFVPVNRLVPLPSGVRAVRVFVSGQHSCVLSDELRVYCWGANIDAQLGRPNVLKRVPLAIDATPIGFSLGAVALSLTDDSTCALLVSNQIECVGSNLRGALGLNPNKAILSAAGGSVQPDNLYRAIEVTVRNVFESVRVQDRDSSRWRASRFVASGTNHCSVTKATGALVCWGQELVTQFKFDGNANSTVFAMSMPSSSARIVGVALGRNNAFGVALDDGDVRLFGTIMVLDAATNGTVAPNNARSAKLPVPKSAVASALASAPACPVAGTFGDDCTCRAAPPDGVMCLGGQLQLVAPLEADEEVDVFADTHVARGQPIDGTVTFHLTANATADPMLYLDGGKCHDLPNAQLTLRMPSVRAVTGATVVVALGCVEKLPSDVTVELSDEPLSPCRPVSTRVEALKMQLLVHLTRNAGCDEPSGGASADNGTLAIIIGASVGGLLCIIAVVVGLVCFVRQQSRADVEAGSGVAPAAAAQTSGGTLAFSTGSSSMHEHTPDGTSAMSTPYASVRTPGEPGDMVKEGIYGEFGSVRSTENYAYGNMETQGAPLEAATPQ
jgi:alpha-tubulin suppressor-like RCC1 family protein